MEHKIIPEKSKLTVRFIKKGRKKGKINKSVICHLKGILSLYYGKVKISECSDAGCLECIDLTLTVPIKKVDREHEILSSARTFLDDFFFSHSVNVHSCNKCQQKCRPSFCSHSLHNKAVV